MILCTTALSLRMASTGNFDLQEIEELISTIGTLTDENLRWSSYTISEIQNKLHHLQDFITPLDGSQDLLSVVADYIENLNYRFTNLPICLPICAHMNNRLVLKVNLDKLEKEFENFKCMKNLYC